MMKIQGEKMLLDQKQERRMWDNGLFSSCVFMRFKLSLKVLLASYMYFIVSTKRFEVVASAYNLVKGTKN